MSSVSLSYVYQVSYANLVSYVTRTYLVFYYT